MMGVVAGCRDVGGGPSSYQPPTRLVSVGSKTKPCCWILSLPTVILSTSAYFLSDLKGTHCTSTFRAKLIFFFSTFSHFMITVLINRLQAELLSPSMCCMSAMD